MFTPSEGAKEIGQRDALQLECLRHVREASRLLGITLTVQEKQLVLDALVRYWRGMIKYSQAGRVKE